MAVVLSGGAINGVLMEAGFLKRLAESELWPRVGWIFGTSAGALAGVMAALDRIDELEEFLIELRPDEVFRPNRLWRLPLIGLHEYTLPATIDRKVGDLAALAEELSHAERELVVFASDVTETERAFGAPLRARLLVARDAARGDEAGDPRLRGDLHARPAAAGRRPHRHRRRLDPQLPARARVRAT